MRIAVLGTGMVARALAGKLDALGHEVALGTRDVAATMSRTEPDRVGGPPIAEWIESRPGVTLVPFAGAATQGELVFLAANGAAAVATLRAAGAQNLVGKILIDVTNPLDFSAGFPPTLFVSDTDSLGERIQRAVPEAKVVKTLNTVNAMVMVDPRSIGDGDHAIFVSGDDAEAKRRVTEILTDWFGWTHVVDLGDITTARGAEMYVAFWVRLMGALGTPTFNIKIVR